MAKSTGKAGIGVVMKLSDMESPPTFATVGNLSNLEAGGRTLNTIDATHLASPDYYREFIAGLKQSDAWSGTVQWDSADPTLDDSTGLGSYLESREVVTLRIDFTGIGVNKALEADGIVTQLGNLSISPEAIISQPFGFQPSGKPRMISLP
jgi:hypothetical protein